MKMTKLFSGLLLFSVFTLTLNGAYTYKKSEYQRRSPAYCYHSKSDKKFRLSRNRIESFFRCQRCFYRDVRLGISSPNDKYPFTLNITADQLTKKEFDSYRANGKSHPIVLSNKLNLIPWNHEGMKDWRNTHVGIEYDMPDKNLIITGAVDDVWMNPVTHELFIVDYKTTSKKQKSLTAADIYPEYKKQLEIYQWLLRHIGFFEVSDTAYIVYYNAKKDAEAFNKHLDFDDFLIPIKGDASWVDGTIDKIYECLQSDNPPASAPNCRLCKFFELVSRIENKK